MPTTVPNLPAELWLAIATELASILEDGRLPRKYMAIHRSFLVLYLDLEYRDIRWTKPCNGMMRQLGQLESDPTIASRVRSFQLSTWFFVNRNQVQLSMLQELYSAILLHLSTYARDAVKTTELTSTAKLFLDRMILAMHNMRNVVDFRVELGGLAVVDSRRLLEASREAFGPNLRRLSVKTSALRFDPLLSLGRLKHLNQLELDFDHEVEVGNRLVEKTEAKTLQRKVIPFLNRYRHSLRALTIVSHSTVDLAPLFRSIGPFPLLRRFSADICLSRGRLSDPEALAQFIHTHQSSLVHLSLQPRVPGENLLTDEELARQHLNSWIPVQQALLKHRGGGGHDDVEQCSLRSLCTPVGDFDLCLEFISRFPHSLRHLSLTDSSLDSTQLEKLRKVFQKEVTILTRADGKDLDSRSGRDSLQVWVPSNLRSR
ncbi:hypothetical protein H1R20_g10470, partial [Candolleomyces eurysporus]